MKQCPICKSTQFSHFLDTRDYFFTQEKFKIIKCDGCGFRITDPIPNEDQISKYYNSENYISHNSSAGGIINRIYSLAQHFNFYLKYNAIKKYVPRGTWMDYGAGNGAFVKYLKSKSLQAVGYEPSSQARENSTEILKDIEHYKYDDHQYACITMWHVLEHVHELEELIKTHRNHLIEKGTLVIAVPNIDSYDSKVYSAEWAALDTPRHLWHFSENDLKRLFEQNGFSHESTKPLHLDSFYVSLLSEKYKKGSSLKGLFVGLYSNILARFNKYPFSSQIYIFRKIPS